MTDLGVAFAALIVSAAGFLVAALALGWQIASWLLDGRRVRVRLVYGLRSIPLAYTGPVKRRGRLPDLDSIRTQGVTGVPVLGVVVTNLGRAPVRIDRYAALHDSKISVVPIGRTIGPDLPFRLAAGETETWYLEAADAIALVKSAQAIPKGTNKVWMTVELGTGDVKRTRRFARF